MPSFTRRAIMESFWRLLDERPLSKISVKDIVEACGINRNTFYYHFQDIPDLIEAIAKTEADEVVQNHARVDSLEECLNIAVEFILKNRRAALHMYNSGNRDIYERYLMKICREVVENYLNTVFGDRRVSPEDHEVIAKCYSCLCFGLFIDWLNDGLKAEIQPMLSRMCYLRQGMIEEMFDRCESKETE